VAREYLQDVLDLTGVSLLTSHQAIQSFTPTDRHYGRFMHESYRGQRRHRERAEQERLRKEREDRRDAHAKLRDELERQAGAWHRARFLRRYIQAARRATSSRPVRLPFVDSTVDFLEWATNYVDQLDPLSNVRKNPDQWPEPRSYVYADDNAMKRWLVRLSGFDGQETRKLATNGIHGITGAGGQNAEKADCES
jgi:hypothetical protein